MSHAATNWAIKQRGLKPATKIVLWHLADCHNAHTGQCNPRQALLADLCEMGRSTLNRHLDELEKRGLIRRHREVDSVTKKQRPTHYTLAMDADETPPKPVSQNGTRPQDLDSKTQHVVEPSPETGHGNGAEPCPIFEQSRVPKWDTKNPGIEPGIDDDDECAECARAQTKSDPGSPAPSLREAILAAMGYDPTGVTASGRIVGNHSDMLELARWQNDLGLGDDEIVQVVRDVVARSPGGPPSTFRYFRRAMQMFAGQRRKRL